MARSQDKSYVIYSRAGPNFFLSIINDKVALAQADPYEDEHQLWYKIVQKIDEKGNPCFTLINKATGQAIKQPVPNQYVELSSANSDLQDESLLWTEYNLSDGYKAISMSKNSSQNWDAQGGKVRDGLRIICYAWNEGNNQQWVIVEWAPLPDNLMGHPVRVVCKEWPESPDYSKSRPDCSISIRDGMVVAAPLNPYDTFQQWFKHEKNSSTFVLIHKATGQAIKHSEDNHPLELINYKSDIDEIMWTEENVSNDYKAIKMANRTSLNWDAQSGRGGTVYSYVWNGGGNQQWIIAPCAPLAPKEPVFKVYCKEWPNYSLSIRDGKVVIALFNPYDESQAWYKHEKAKDFYHNFILVNKATGEAIKHPIATSRDSFVELRMTAYIPNVDDKSILWTEWTLVDGYKAIGMANDTSDMTWDAAASDSSVGCYPWRQGNNQRWIIAPH